MVGFWSPEPPSEPVNENLTAQNPIFMPVAGTSDDEEDDLGYEGYEPISDADTSIPDSPDSDIEDGLNEGASGVSAALPLERDEGQIQDEDNVRCEGAAECARGQGVRDLWLSPLSEDNIELGVEQTAQVLAAMANITLPPTAIPSWAASVPEDQWKQHLMERIQNLQKGGVSE